MSSIETTQTADIPVVVTSNISAHVQDSSGLASEGGPANTLETCTVWSMNGKFIKPGDLPNPGYMNYPCDDGIKEFIKRPSVGQAFLHILINALSFTPEQRMYPAEIMTENASANEQLDSSSVMDSIHSVITFTGNPADTISNTRLRSVLNSRNIVIGKMALAKFLKDNGAISCKFSNKERGYSGISIT